MVCGEAELPYDRPPLSKGMLAGEVEESEVGFRPAGWYADQWVELIFAAAPWDSTRSAAASGSTTTASSATRTF